MLRQKFHKAALIARKVAICATLVPASLLMGNLFRAAYADIAQQKPHDYQQYRQWNYSDQRTNEIINTMNRRNSELNRSYASADNMIDRLIWPTAAGAASLVLTGAAVALSRPRQKAGLTKVIL